MFPYLQEDFEDAEVLHDRIAPGVSDNGGDSENRGGYSGGNRSDSEYESVGGNQNVVDGHRSDSECDSGGVLSDVNPEDRRESLSTDGEDTTILEDTDADHDPTTDESRYESTVEQHDSDESVNSDDFDSTSESPPPNRPTSRARPSRNINPPPIFTYNKIGGEPSLCHSTARSRR